MVSRLFRFLLGVVLLAISSSSWAQIIHWEIDGEIVEPGTSASQERAYSGGFDFNTVTGDIFNVTVFSSSTTVFACNLCFDYSGADGMYQEALGAGDVTLEKQVGPDNSAHRINTLRLIGVSITQPGVQTASIEEWYYFIAGTGDPVDDIFVSDGCVNCATLTGTLVPVPEPETYAMLLAGLGLIGLRGRRKQLAKL